jgi:hypothetical protein
MFRIVVERFSEQGVDDFGGRHVVPFSHVNGRDIPHNISHGFAVAFTQSIQQLFLVAKEMIH